MALERVSTVGTTKRTATRNRPLLPRPKSEWRSQLTSKEYSVLRQAATEAPYVGEYTDNHRTGIYRCRACGSELFRSNAKFDSHCGWPSFFTPLAGDRVLGDQATAAAERYAPRSSARTGHSHMGHVFAGEGYDTPTGFVCATASTRSR